MKLLWDDLLSLLYWETINVNADLKEDYKYLVGLSDKGETVTVVELTPEARLMARLERTLPFIHDSADPRVARVLIALKLPPLPLTGNGYDSRDEIFRTAQRILRGLMVRGPVFEKHLINAISPTTHAGRQKIAKILDLLDSLEKEP